MGSWKDYPARKVNGKWLCRWCGKECSGRRTSFCSNQCGHELSLRCSTSYLRAVVRKRDKGVCALCGLHTIKIQRELGRIRRTEGLQAYYKAKKKLGVPRHRKTLWDADHEVPVCRDGGECGLENIRTLCIWCHRKETNKLRRQLAAEKRKSK